jgi:hypothetical protein
MGYSGMTLGYAMASVMTGGAATWGAGWAAVMGAGAGFGSAFAGSLLNGGSVGDAFKAGAIGAVVGGISAGMASKIGDFAEANDWFQGTGQNLAHGTLQGGLTEATGGQFRHGFYAGFSSSALAGPISRLAPDDAMGQTVAAAVVGGTASAVGGGKFANGAVSGAFTQMFNAWPHPKTGDMLVDQLDIGNDAHSTFQDTYARHFPGYFGETMYDGEGTAFDGRIDVGNTRLREIAEIKPDNPRAITDGKCDLSFYLGSQHRDNLLFGSYLKPSRPYNANASWLFAAPGSEIVLRGRYATYTYRDAGEGVIAYRYNLNENVRQVSVAYRFLRLFENSIHLPLSTSH